jgi:MinD-like ATPase involved in chromosome partitioning or flagellar assembly
MRTITFYSYKGGVGRSLALQSIATRLAEFGRQVCLLDFDLEAPGLHHKFAASLANNAQKIDRGIVDYIYAFAEEGVLADSLREYSYSWFPYKQSCITLIPAGDPDSNSGSYWKKLSSINWYELLYEGESGLALLLDLKEKIRREFAPDYLLVDSRTGISELSGIALSLFADEVVVMAVNNRENLEGSKKIMRIISDPERMVLGKAPKVNFVLSRIPFTISPEDRVKEQNLKTRIRQEFGSLISDLTILHSDRELEENEQLKMGYDKDDSGAAQISRDLLELFEKLTLGELSDLERESFRKIKESEKLFLKAQQTSDPIAALRLLNEAIALNNYNTEFHLSKASVYEKQSEWEKVLEACEEILKYETLDLRPFEGKANALFHLSRISDSRAMYEYVLGREPGREAALLGLARIAIIEHDFDKALRTLDGILDRNPLNALAFLERAKLKRNTGHGFAAFDDAFQAANVQLDNAEAFLIMAKIYADQRNKYEFYLNIERALQLKNKLDRPIEQEIQTEATFQPFLKDAQFLKILERHNIRLSEESEQSLI